MIYRNLPSAGRIKSNRVGIDRIRMENVNTGRIIRSDHVCIGQIRLKNTGAGQPRLALVISGHTRSAQADKGQAK